MGNAWSRVVRKIGDCPRRETQEQARLRIVREMKEEEALLREAQDKKIREINSIAAKAAALKGREYMKAAMKRENMRIEFKQMLQKAMEKPSSKTGQLGTQINHQGGQLRTLKMKLDELLLKTTSITEQVSENGDLLQRMIALEQETEMVSQDSRFTKLELTEDLREMQEKSKEIMATALSAHDEIVTVGEMVSEVQDKIENSVSSEVLEELRQELQTEAEQQSRMHLDENKELRSIIQSLADTVSSLESKIEGMQQELGAADEMDEIYCDSCATSDAGGAASSKKPRKNNNLDLFSPLPKGPETEHDKIVSGKLIPRCRINERVDMVDWQKLDVVPTKGQQDKLTKWDEVIIRTLTSPPLRSNTPWKMWKEAVWHWARQLRLVGATFHMMGRHLVNQAFVGDRFEGEHSIAARIESDLYKVRRLDGQAPLLFLMLLKKVFLREEQINDGKAVRMETAKVDRALVAMMLKALTTQLIRSKISTATSTGGDFTLGDLEREVDNLNITDYNRYKLGVNGQDVHVKMERDEEDTLTGLLEVIGERMTTDSVGHHAVTNRYFNLTQRIGAGAGAANVGTGQGTVLFTPQLGGLDMGEGASGTGLPAGPAPQSQHLMPTPGTALATGGQQFSNNPNGETVDVGGKKHYLPPRLSEPEKQKRNEDAKAQKLKLDPDADWCQFGEFCPKILEEGRCPKKHLKKEVWKLLSERKNERTGSVKRKRGNDSDDQSLSSPFAKRQVRFDQQDQENTNSFSYPPASVSGSDISMVEIDMQARPGDTLRQLNTPENGSDVSMRDARNTQHTTISDPRFSNQVAPLAEQEDDMPSEYRMEPERHADSVSSSDRQNSDPLSQQGGQNPLLGGGDFHVGEPDEHASEYLIRRMAPHTKISSASNFCTLEFSEKHGQYYAGKYKEGLPERAASILKTSRDRTRPTSGKAGLDSCSSHNPIPESIFLESRHLNPGSRRASKHPTRFGTVSSDRADCTAPTSTTEAETFFLVNDGPHIYAQVFHIIDQGVVAAFPILLGQPFFWEYELILSYKNVPPTVTIAGIDYALAPEPIAMIEIQFVSRAYAQGRWVPPSPARLHLLDAESKLLLQGLASFTSAAPGKKKWRFAESYITWTGRPKTASSSVPTTGASIFASMEVDDEEMVLDAVDEAMAANNSRVSSEQGLAPQSRVTSNSSTRETAQPASSIIQTGRNSLEGQFEELYRFMRNEHRSLGHSKSVEMLYDGNALRCLREIRENCRFCQGFDNNAELRRAGALQQFAASRNIKWLIDLIFVKVGVLVKIVDVCTRMRVLELCDGALGKGGRTGSAIKCYMRAKRMLGGAPEVLIFDLGQEFISRRFQKVVEVDNVECQGIGYKEPWRISKLERGNRQDKQRAMIATEQPYEPCLEVFLWGLAMEKVEEELFDWNWEDLMDEVVSIEPHSGEAPEAFVIKQLIVAEIEWQANQVPMLGTTIAPQNAHAGSFTRGDRDWEEQILASDQAVEDVELDEADAFFRRNALTQERCRRVILEKDIELLQRRRELVSRTFQRGGDISKYQVGDAVFIRRPVSGRFSRWHAGTITSVNAGDRTVAINRGGQTQPYGLHDVAHLPPVSEHFQHEFYPDDHMLELIAARGGIVAMEDDSGVLQEMALQALNRCNGAVQLCADSGSLFFAADNEVPDADTDRAVDMSVLPKVKTILEEQNSGKQVFRLTRGPNEICFLMTQLSNGRCIRKELNVKDSRDIKHVCVEAHCFKHKVTGQLPVGRRFFIRWGDELSPMFCSEEAAREEIADTWVVAAFYETCVDTHEAMEKHGDGNKSGTIVVTLKDAAKLGFLHYAYAAMGKEVKTVCQHGIFKETVHTLEELRRQGRNVVPSRMLLVIKIDRITGAVVKVKARWITQGFRDRRFHGSEESAMPPRRSHTIADVTVSLLANFFQTTRKTSSLKDILEAFLRGKRMIDMYDRRSDIEAFCHIPDEIQELHAQGVPVLGEARGMDKFLYGQKDAPAGWECTLWDYSLGIGFTQSMADPCLFLYFPNSVEVEILRRSEQVQLKYYMDKVREVRQIENTNLAARVAVLEQGAESRQGALLPCELNKSFANPHSQLINDQLVPHCQREENPDGGFGVHVDDLWGGGGLIYWLRVLLLLDSVELGSFCWLDSGTRDCYVGRELTVVPQELDQWRMLQYLEQYQEQCGDSGIQFPPGALTAPTEEELANAERQYGVKRTTQPHEYREAEKLKYDPFDIPNRYQMRAEVVYYLAQEVYATKLSVLEEEEVNDYFLRRRRAGTNRFARKQVKSPFKGRLGELIWLKSNAVISATVSGLASLGHEVEKCESYDEVSGFVADLSGVIMLAKWVETNTQRVFRLAGPRQVFLAGAADAGMDRVGAMPVLAALDHPRANTPSSISKKPGRVFSSSTGIEVLAQKILSSELIFILQLLLDLAICSIGRPLLQLCDSRNTVCEPRERNLKPDFQGLASMIRAKMLEMTHIPGATMFVDGLTKDLRNGQVWLLHLAANWGLIDADVWGVVQSFIKKILHREEERHQLRAEDLVHDEGTEDFEIVLPPPPACTPAADGRLYLTANGNGWTATTDGQDYWWEDDVKIVRECPVPRVAKFTPVSKAVPMPPAPFWVLLLFRLMFLAQATDRGRLRASRERILCADSGSRAKALPGEGAALAPAPPGTGSSGLVMFLGSHGVAAALGVVWLLFLVQLVALLNLERVPEGGAQRRVCFLTRKKWKQGARVSDYELFTGNWEVVPDPNPVEAYPEGAIVGGRTRREFRQLVQQHDENFQQQMEQEAIARIDKINSSSAGRVFPSSTSSERIAQRVFELREEQANRSPRVRCDYKTQRNFITPTYVHSSSNISDQLSVPTGPLMGNCDSVQSWQKMVTEFIKMRKRGNGKLWHKRGSDGIGCGPSEPHTIVCVRLKLEGDEKHLWYPGLMNYLNLDSEMATVRVNGKTMFVPSDCVKVVDHNCPPETDFEYRAGVILGFATRDQSMKGFGPDHQGPGCKMCKPAKKSKKSSKRDLCK
eukprot:g18093.t1